MRLAMAQQAAGQRSEATASLVEAVEAADVLGAGLVVEQTHAFAERAGLSLGGAAERHEAGSVDLTAREQQVLELITEGLTNRQIGERLFISVKTASVLCRPGELGASSRTEAAVIAGRSRLGG